MENPRFLEGDMSTDFVAEEWDGRNAGTQLTAAAPEDAGTADSPTLEEVAAIVGSLLMNEQVEEEKLRRQPVGENGNGVERSRWRERGWREAMRGV
jgi:hypothetical protein